MKIVVIGGSGLIGSKLVAKLRHKGHDVTAASPSTGINAVTGEGLAAALAGAQVVVDVSNSPSFEDKAVLDFFSASTANLLAAAATAGIKHFVALSVVGTDRLADSGYFRAKLVQEDLIRANGKVPYTILRATQFFEFMGGIAQAGTQGNTVRLTSALMQPIVSDDVAEALADVALAAPIHGISEVAGPDRKPMNELVQQALTAAKDSRQIVVDTAAPYFGVVLNDQSLTPGAGARIMPTRFGNWLSHQPAKS